MRVDILTLFPEMIEAPLRASLLGKALEEGALEVEVTNIRDFTHDRHRTADDAPYGGGPGMVMRAEPVFEAVESLRGRNSLGHVTLMSPRGRRLHQDIVRELAAEPDLVLICGRYEGVDERVSQGLCHDEISIGDYVLSGGELPALVLVEAMSRMVPGVVGDWGSVETDSFYEGILGPPQYTRPAEYRGMKTPPVLLEGHHAKTARWRRMQALAATRSRRPDLLASISEDDARLLEELDREEQGPE
jgi:tRNA (guanine37-N1)-methyltransferase